MELGPSCGSKSDVKQKIKILMFGWEIPPYNSGGLGVACLGLMKALMEQGAQISFVLPKKLNITLFGIKIIFADNEHLEDTELYSAYVSSDKFSSLTISKANSSISSSLFDNVESYARQARKIAKREDFDVIHAHDWLSFKAGVEAKKVSGKPLVVHVHATEFDRSGGLNVNQTVYEIEKYGLEQADQVIAVSNYTKRMLVEKYGIAEDKITVVHNGVDQTQTDPHQNELLAQFKKQGCKLVIFVGRLTLQKGPDYFLKAAKKVLQFDPKVIFVFAGSGDMQHELIEQAVSLGISGSVYFAGFLRDEELTALYHSADLFVLPSVSEPFGIAPLESVINGTPVLISKQSGVSEVLTHALKTDFWDIDDMVDKILSVLDHDSLRTTLKDNSEQEVKGITWQKAAAKCVQIYRKIMGNFKQ